MGLNSMKEVRKHRIDLHITEPNHHNQSKVEGVIREVRKKWFRVMLIKKGPHRLWDYGLKWVAGIHAEDFRFSELPTLLHIPRRGDM